jgi:ABC-type lipoprotein release transport system permease subunit
MAIKRRFGEKKGTAKPKGAKGQSYKKKDKNKIKTKAKTVNRNLSKRQQHVAMAKSMRTNLDINRNRKLDEAAPAAISDVETMPRVEE